MVVVNVYLGSYYASGKFQAVLHGGETYTDITPVHPMVINTVYTLRVPVAATDALRPRVSSDRTLAISWTQTNGTNVNFASITVSDQAGAEHRMAARGSAARQVRDVADKAGGSPSVDVFLQSVALSAVAV